jgi:heparanase 1
VATRRASAGHMLTPRELADVDRWADAVEQAVDTHAGKAAVWLGETGSAQCGGEPGFSDGFSDALWWADVLGRMARRGQAVLIRQTLAGSNYGLIDEATLTPNPSYWASWLWRQLMDRRVLAAGPGSARSSLRTYVHCTREGAPGHAPGGVTALLVNVDRHDGAEVTLPAAAARSARAFVLTERGLDARAVALNGRPLLAAADGGPPALAALARPASAAGVTVPPRSVAFVVLPDAGAAACR